MEPTKVTMVVDAGDFRHLAVQRLESLQRHLMKGRGLRLVGGAVAFVTLTAVRASAQLEPSCVEHSPERRGEIGCSLVETKPLPGTLKEPLFWHIDRFDSGGAAQAAAGPSGVALEAHGMWWLLTIESGIDVHHGGQHVAQVGLPPLPQASKYSMLVMSAWTGTRTVRGIAVGCTTPCPRGIRIRSW
jgi:hypothetical protein